MGWWGKDTKHRWKVDETRKRVLCLWELRGSLKVTQWGDRFMLFEFVSVGEEEWVLNFGQRSFKRVVLHLVKWNRSIGCSESTNLEERLGYGYLACQSICGVRVF